LILVDWLFESCIGLVIFAALDTAELLEQRVEKGLCSLRLDDCLA